MNYNISPEERVRKAHAILEAAIKEADALAPVPVVSMPKPHPTVLVGRDESLERLALLFEGQSTDGIRHARVTGPHGAGKSALAFTFAQSRMNKYSGGVFWLSAVSNKALMADVRRVLTDLKMSPSDRADPVEMCSTFRSWMMRNTGWLVVFDGADDPRTLLKHILPTSGRGDLLYTMRTDVGSEMEAPSLLLHSRDTFETEPEVSGDCDLCFAHGYWPTVMYQCSKHHAKNAIYLRVADMFYVCVCSERDCKNLAYSNHTRCSMHGGHWIAKTYYTKNDSGYHC
jgi:hypothetical protein